MLIRLPRIVSKLKTFCETVTFSHDRAVEIRQDETAATVTAADGHQLCRITAPPPEGGMAMKVEPFLVDARDLSKAAAEVGCSRTEAIVSADPQHVSAKDRPLLVARVDEKSVAVAGPEGSPQTIAIVKGSMPDCAKIVDVIRHEATVGNTKAVGRIDPRLLQNVADLAVAMGITSIEITFAPRLNYLMAEGTAPDGCSAQFAIAGIGDVNFEAIAARPTPAWEVDDALTFEMPQSKPRASTRRKPKPPQAKLWEPDDVPF